MIVASVGHPIGFDRKIENAELFSLRHSVLKQRSERNAQGGTLMIEHSQPVYEMDGRTSPSCGDSPHSFCAMRPARTRGEDG
jgi:hypothetical protein